MFYAGSSMKFLVTAVLCAFLLALNASGAEGFSFSADKAKEEQAEKAEKDAKEQKIRELMSVPGSESLKNKKTALVIVERHSDGFVESQHTNYGPLFAEINKRLQAVGIKTYAQEEINQQIAWAQRKAMLSSDDPDAAREAAARKAAARLGADFIIKGVIESRTRVNPLLQVNEVYVTIAFTLVNAAGKSLSNVTEEGDSFAGPDTLSAAMNLVREKADLIVAQLFHDYCQSLSKK